MHEAHTAVAQVRPMGALLDVPQLTHPRRMRMRAGVRVFIDDMIGFGFRDFLYFGGGGHGTRPPRPAAAKRSNPATLPDYLFCFPG